jgi:GTP cyclohydrolase I
MNDAMKHNISQKEAEEAVRTLLRWIGEDPEREGLIDTPQRFIKSYAEKFAGYKTDPKEVLSKQFSETAGYKGIIILADIAVESFCEHHIEPIVGRAHVGYIPKGKVVGISKLARLVEVFTRRLQLQERLTAQIAHAINDCLMPEGVAVMVEAKHHCICHRGVHHRDAMMMTSSFLGVFENDQDLVKNFMDKIKAYG